MTAIFNRCLLIVLPLIFVSSIALAQAELLTLAEAERLALSNEPSILAAQARAASMQEKSISAGALPDPQLRLGVMSLPTDSYSFNQEEMTQKQIAVQQMFPPAGSRKAMRQQLNHQSEALAHTADARARWIVREVRDTYLEGVYWQEAKRIIEENREWFTQLLTITRTLYSVGQQNQPALLQAELELRRVEDQLLAIDEQSLRSQSSLRQWIGSSAFNFKLDTNIQLLQNYSDQALLRTQLLQHPLLLAIQAQIASAASGKDLAHSQYRPSVGIELAYGQREEDPFGNPRNNFMSAMVMLSVPLFTGNRQDKDLSAAEYAHTASLNDRDALLRELIQKLDSSLARSQQLHFRIELYNETILKQSRLQAQSTLQAYQNNTSDFTEVMRAITGDLNTQLDFIRLTIDQAKAHAELDYLVGNITSGVKP